MGGEDGGFVGLFKGYVFIDNNGGFVSICLCNFEFVLDLSVYGGFEFWLKGDGYCFKFMYVVFIIGIFLNIEIIVLIFIFSFLYFDNVSVF